MLGEMKYVGTMDGTMERWNVRGGKCPRSSCELTRAKALLYLLRIVNITIVGAATVPIRITCTAVMAIYRSRGKSIRSIN